MTTWIDVLTVLVILLNLRLLVTSRLGACIQTVALQALLLGAIAWLRHAGSLTLEFVLILLASVGLKSLLLPWLLSRSVRECGIRREVTPWVGFSLSGLIGLGLLAGCVYLSDRLAPTGDPSLLIATALFTMVTGLSVIISRRKAITQVLGYLAMENGIWAFGLAFAVQEPLLVEMGVLLDVLVGVFVMGITISHISREFDHIDTDRLSALKD